MVLEYCIVTWVWEWWSGHCPYSSWSFIHQYPCSSTYRICWNPSYSQLGFWMCLICPQIWPIFPWFIPNSIPMSVDHFIKFPCGKYPMIFVPHGKLPIWDHINFASSSKMSNIPMIYHMSSPSCGASQEQRRHQDRRCWRHHGEAGASGDSGGRVELETEEIVVDYLLFNDKSNGYLWLIID